jgi:hypothetical protein
MKKECEIDGCDTKNTKKIIFCKGLDKYLCSRHYHQFIVYGKIIKIKNIKFIQVDDCCCFCGASGKKYKLSYFEDKIYCRKHYDHMRLYGHCKERTIFDRNEIINCGDYSEIILYNLDQTEKARAIIDTEDVDKISKYKWNLGSHGYAVCTVLQRCLHTFLLDLTDDDIADHEDRNRLNNRKSNLRITDDLGNSANKEIPISNNSGVMGICWDSINNKWIAGIKRDGVSKSKRFKNFNDAVIQRLKWEKELFGEFAPQRHLYEQYGIE